MKTDMQTLTYYVAAFRTFRTKPAARRLRDKLRRKQGLVVSTFEDPFKEFGTCVEATQFFGSRVAAIACADYLLRVGAMNVHVSKT